MFVCGKWNVSNVCMKADIYTWTPVCSVWRVRGTVFKESSWCAYGTYQENEKPFTSVLGIVELTWSSCLEGHVLSGFRVRVCAPGTLCTSFWGNETLPQLWSVQTTRVSLSSLEVSNTQKPDRTISLRHSSCVPHLTCKYYWILVTWIVFFLAVVSVFCSDKGIKSLAEVSSQETLVQQ